MAASGERFLSGRVQTCPATASIGCDHGRGGCHLGCANAGFGQEGTVAAMRRSCPTMTARRRSMCCWCPPSFDPAGARHDRADRAARPRLRPLAVCEGPARRMPGGARRGGAARDALRLARLPRIRPRGWGRMRRRMSCRSLRELQRQYPGGAGLPLRRLDGRVGRLTFAALHPDLVDGVMSMNGTANFLEYDNFQDAIRRRSAARRRRSRRSTSAAVPNTGPSG